MIHRIHHITQGVTHGTAGPPKSHWKAPASSVALCWAASPLQKAVILKEISVLIAPVKLETGI